MTMTQKRIMHAIETYNTIIIHRHVRQDPDAIGSQCSLKQLIKQSFPENEVYAVGAEEDSFTSLHHMLVIYDQVYEGALVITCNTANNDRICDQRHERGDMLIKIDHHPNKDAYGDVLYVYTNYSSTSGM